MVILLEKNIFQLRKQAHRGLSGLPLVEQTRGRVALAAAPEGLLGGKSCGWHLVSALSCLS